MMHTKGLFRACLAVVLAAVGCQDQAVTAPPSSRAASRAAATPSATARIPGPGVDASRVRLPAGLVDEHMGDAPGRVINPGDYQCSSNSPINNFYSSNALRVYTREPGIYLDLYYLAGFSLPGYEALVFGVPGKAQQYFGYTGSFTNALIRTERDVKRFWDIPSASIRMVAMHGTVLADSARVDRTYQAVYGVPAPYAALYASILKADLAQSRTLDGGNNPILTFNAFAFPGYNDGTLAFSPTIVMGDGILEGYATLGFGDVAPQAVYAHEFGHQVQFANGYFGDSYATTGSGAERTRYTELMADAFSGYYLTHKRGAALNRHRVEEFLQVFFQIGDCGFNSAGHHGTPNQRMKSATLGFEIADQAQKQGHILTSAQFHDRFVAAYPQIVAPDAVAAAR